VSDHPRRVRIEGQGITEIGQIKAGETVVVSSAAGATGSVAGQIAKIKGCRVIGTAGGKEKCDWLVKQAHFDAAIDYKSEDLGARLSELCPNGIDVFFDNVGGEVLNKVLARINLNARIVLCGLDLEIRHRHAAAGPRELLQSGGQAGAHGGLHRA
jgi:NADPH-dependent curcumin reductase CurA